MVPMWMGGAQAVQVEKGMNLRPHPLPFLFLEKVQFPILRYGWWGTAA